MHSQLFFCLTPLLLMEMRSTSLGALPNTSNHRAKKNLPMISKCYSDKNNLNEKSVKFFDGLLKIRGVVAAAVEYYYLKYPSWHCQYIKYIDKFTVQS
jgi:hypothetical protein